MERDVAALLALTLGFPLREQPVDWRNMLDLARGERCAPLAWLRSANAIRGAAPADVTVAWRAEAMSAISLAGFWRSVTAETVAALRAAGVEPIVLKGLPLGERLYGDVAARPCADLDLYIGLAARSAAHGALIANGWRWRRGEAPRESGYRLDRAGREAVLEVHSSLLDDGLVAHLPFAQPRARIEGGENGAVASHDDSQLPAFLATHLAKHTKPPLLWFVDLATLWGSLDAPARRDAWAAARSARAHQYLAWSLKRLCDLDAAVAGDDDAVRRLGFRAGGRRELHSAIRVALYAATPADALRVAGAWLVPPDARGSVSAIGGLFVARVQKALGRIAWMWHAAAVRTRSSIRLERGRNEPTEAKPSLSVNEAEFASLVGDLIARGTRFAIRARGVSMLPAIPAGAVVSLAPADTESTKVGIVVLTKTASSGYVLHRVSRVGGGLVQTWGDGNMRPDPELPLASVVACAVGLVVDGREREIPPAEGRTVRRLIAAARWRLGWLLEARRPWHGREIEEGTGASVRSR